MKISSSANKIIELLQSSGYDAYVVGGYVRDCILGHSGGDIDVTTSATPAQMQKVFKNLKTYPTGLKHGTITVEVDKVYIEVTTFRTEGAYSDNRRPDSVNFVTSLEEDLKRRDFTINALAYNDKTGLVDLFDGIKDIKNKVIKTVGNPDERFLEDALRIMRALRFASVLDFEIESQTALSIIKNAKLLRNVSKERVFVELNKMLCGVGAERVLTSFKEVIFEIIPELKLSSGFLQHSKYHSYDVYTHTVKSVCFAPQDKTIRLALLLHDVAKPICFSIDESGGHFYGHEKKGSEIATSILKRLKADNATIKFVKDSILLHDKVEEISKPTVKRFLGKYGLEFLSFLTEVKIADSKAHAKDYVSDRVVMAREFLNLAKEVVSGGECYLLKHLKINGTHLKALGYKGREIHDKLNEILNDVIDGKVSNDIESLLKRL